MSVAFSSKEEEAISRKIHVENDKDSRKDDPIDDFYEIDRCSNWIRENQFKKVALQFPDNYLKDAAELSQLLEKETGCETFISGDTSYGSCCVDEITAEHVSCDSIIHFGHACLSPTNRLPVLYIFGKIPCDVDDAAGAFRKMFQDIDSHVVVLHEVFYNHVINGLEKLLSSQYKNVIFSSLYLQNESRTDEENSEVGVTLDSCMINKCGRTFQLPKSKLLSSYEFFYIGSENMTLLNLMLTFSSNKFYSYEPRTGAYRKETLDINKYLRKRYYYIEKAKDANIIGILVGTLGVSKYLDVIDHLKKIIKEAGKKAYTLVVGKLNEAKLANFAEIEVYVCVACSECSLIDSHDFYQPIVTPFEMETALNKAREWTGQYITDFRELLPGAASHVPFEAAVDEGDVSLVTGKIRLSNDEVGKERSSDSDMVLRNDMVIANKYADGFTTRVWKGLEQQLGETPVAEILKGRRGIASGYDDENESCDISIQ